MENILEWDPDHLVYDPHPELDNWRGTASPPIDHPLVRSPERWKIAGGFGGMDPLDGWSTQFGSARYGPHPDSLPDPPYEPMHRARSTRSAHGPWPGFGGHRQPPVAPATQTKAPLRRAVIAGSDSILFSHDWKFVPRAFLLCRPTDSPTVGDGFQYEIFYGL